MEQGVHIFCKKKAGQFLLTEKPYCIVNEIESIRLNWGKWNFIHLLPGMPYQLRIQFPYMGKECCPATLNISVEEGEVVRLRYKVPFIVTSPGILQELD